MSAGIMFAVIGSIVMPFFLFEKVNIMIIRNNKAGYTANTSRGRVGRGGNARLSPLRMDRPTD